MPIRHMGMWKLASATFLLGLLGIAADIQEQMTPAAWVEVVLKQGAPAAILFAVLFFYRRDYESLANFWKANSAQQTLDAARKDELIARVHVAMTEMAGAVREHTRVVHDSKTAMQALVGQIELMRARQDDQDRPERRQRPR